MGYEKEIHEYIENHKDELLNDLFDLMRINSEKMDPLPGKPFGEGPAKALAKGIEILDKYGFKTCNHDNYVISGDLGPDDRALDILAHLDVVPAGDEADWHVTKPFEPLIKDGILYGRGSSDDKGPAVSAIFALRAIKELGLPLKKGVRLILGSDEECGSSDIEHYYKTEKPAPMSISPDANWPLINIEKGGLANEFSADYEKSDKTPCLVSFNGGVKINVAPGKANASVRGISAKEVKTVAEKVTKETGVHFNLNEKDGLTFIEAVGETCHASIPETGKNAITALTYLIAKLPLSDAPVNEYIRKLDQVFPFGKVNGEGLGVAIEDAESGKTTVSFDIINVTETHFSGQFDMRASIAANEENTGDVIERRLTDLGFNYVRKPMFAPHIVSADSKLVKTLLKSYEKGFGVTGAKPLAIGGGTYVHHVEGGVAFGCEEEGFDNRMHGADERMKVSLLTKSAEIFADAILSLCND